jgi:hypothetical protein
MNDKSRRKMGHSCSAVPALYCRKHGCVTLSFCKFLFDWKKVCMGYRTRQFDSFEWVCMSERFECRLVTSYSIIFSNSCMYYYIKVAGVDPIAGSVVPSIKLEYQARLGPEVCSPSHLAREWLEALLRPSSTTVRLRYR